MLGGLSTIGTDLDAVTEVAAILDARAVNIVFQPVVRLDTRETVGYEALARGPAGTRWESPVQLFCGATALGRLGELDWICRAHAYRASLAAGLPPELPLFVNTDSAADGAPCPDDLRSIVDAARDRLRVVAETTERVIAGRPLALLAAATAQRRAGHGVALDDVGVNPAVLALLPLALPDVVKLDGYLLRRPDRIETARVVTAVSGYAEQTGASVLAEGIETEEHLAVARSLGATLGQGWLLGRPAPLPYRPGVPERPVRLPGFAASGPGPAGPPYPTASPYPAKSSPDDGTPYQVVTRHRAPRLADRAALLRISRYLEAKACDAAEPAVVLSCVQRAARLSGATGWQYAALAGSAGLVVVYGVGVGDEPVPGVRGVRLERGTALAEEWNVVVLGPLFAGALVARDLGVAGDRRERRYAYAVTYDRGLVTDAARRLLAVAGVGAATAADAVGAVKGDAATAADAATRPLRTATHQRPGTTP